MTMEISIVRSPGDAVLNVLARFADAPAEILADRALQRRVDRKYLLPVQQLGPLLTRLQADYCVLRSGRKPLAQYESIYFDTPERQFYDDHRRGRQPRYKVRIRHHLDRQLTFLEIKRKEKSGYTTKFRLQLPFAESQLGAEARSFIEEYSPICGARLVPCVTIAFFRITLVGASVNERLTFDWDVAFHDEHRREGLPGVVIAEIKQRQYSNASTAIDALRALHVRSQDVSKYCLATSRLAPVRVNRFRPALRAVERLSRCENC